MVSIAIIMLVVGAVMAIVGGASLGYGIYKKGWTSKYTTTATPTAPATTVTVSNWSKFFFWSGSAMLALGILIVIIVGGIMLYRNWNRNKEKSKAATKVSTMYDTI